MQLCRVCVTLAMGPERLGGPGVDAARTEAEKVKLLAKLNAWYQRDGDTLRVYVGENPMEAAWLPLYAVTAVGGTPVCALHVHLLL